MDDFALFDGSGEPLFRDGLLRCVPSPIDEPLIANFGAGDEDELLRCATVDEALLVEFRAGDFEDCFFGGIFSTLDRTLKSRNPCVYECGNQNLKQ